MQLRLGLRLVGCRPRSYVANFSIAAALHMSEVTPRASITSPCGQLRVGGTSPLRGVVTWGDTLHPHYREAIERAFLRAVLDTYGIGEGMQIASQCERRSLYHIHTLDVVVECVDGEGRPLPPGEPGQLLVTRLHPGPMPLIRYRVGDLGVMSERHCPCGRGFLVWKSILGPRHRRGRYTLR